MVKKAPIAADTSVGEKNEVEYTKAPHSFVFHRGKVGKNISNLVADLRRIMEPYTASQLQSKKKNCLKDFVSVAAALNVSNFLILSKSESAVNLKIAHVPRGPTLSFNITDYMLIRDLVPMIKRHNMEPQQFHHHPLVIMNGFSGEGMHLKLMATMFQNMFPSININQVKLDQIRRCVLFNFHNDTNTLDIRHYNIRVVPVGMSRAVKKLIRGRVPDMSRYKDVNDYIEHGGNLSESEAEMDGPHNEVTLPQKLSTRGNIKSTKSAIRLTEIGPRISLHLMKIEEGLCDGNVLFHSYIQKTKEEIAQLKLATAKKKKTKAMRKKQQQENIKRKERLKEEAKQKSLEGMRKAGVFKTENEDEVENPGKESDESDGLSDREYYKQEVGVEPDKGLLPSHSKRRKRASDDNVPKKKVRFQKTEKAKHQPDQDSHGIPKHFRNRSHGNKLNTSDKNRGDNTREKFHSSKPSFGKKKGGSQRMSRPSKRPGSRPGTGSRLGKRPGNRLGKQKANKFRK